MRIGIDIDDTICSTFDFILPYCCKYYGIDYNEAKEKGYSLEYLINNYGYYDFAKKYYGKIIPYVPLKKDVVKYLNKIKKRGHQIIFITARSNRGYDNPYQLTYDYLVKNNVPFDELITDVLEKDKACVDESIDIYLDNDINNCRKTKAIGINTYLNISENSQKNKEFKCVKNFRQFYKIIKKEEKSGRRKSSN